MGKGEEVVSFRCREGMQGEEKYQGGENKYNVNNQEVEDELTQNECNSD